MSTIVTAADAAHFLSLVPRLVGYTPTESLVVVPLHEGRSLGALRVDLPPDGADLDATASTVVGLVCRVDGVEALIAIVYTAAPVTNVLPGAELVYRIRELAPDPNTFVVVNCAGRTRSIVGAQTLIDAGIPNRVAWARCCARARSRLLDCACWNACSAGAMPAATSTSDCASTSRPMRAAV